MSGALWSVNLIHSAVDWESKYVLTTNSNCQQRKEFKSMAQRIRNL